MKHAAGVTYSTRDFSGLENPPCEHVLNGRAKCNNYRDLLVVTLYCKNYFSTSLGPNTDRILTSDLNFLRVGARIVTLSVCSKIVSLPKVVKQVKEGMRPNVTISDGNTRGSDRKRRSFWASWRPAR